MYVCARESLKLARLERVREAVRIPGGYTHAPEHPSHGRVQLKAGSKPTGRRRRGSPAGDAAERKEAKDHRWSEQTHADTATKGAAHDTAPRAVELSHRVRLCQTPSSTTTTTHPPRSPHRRYRLLVCGVA